MLTVRGEDRLSTNHAPHHHWATCPIHVGTHGENGGEDGEKKRGKMVVAVCTASGCLEVHVPRMDASQLHPSQVPVRQAKVLHVPHSKHAPVLGI